MSFVLDLTRGAARVRQVVFNRGQPRPTVSIGRAAAWSLVADDLEDVHAFVSFDGAALMVRSAEEHNPVWLDGQAVPCAWTPVGRASILALGNARITVTAKEDHVRPGRDDDDEVTGQIEMRPPANTGATAVTGPPSATRNVGDASDDEQRDVTGDEPTGEMTGVRAPQRGLLPRPRMPPRASAGMRATAPVRPTPAPPPARLEVPEFDDPTQLRGRDLAPAAGRRAPAAAPLPVTTDDEERTHALDLHAMQAAQRPAARPSRPERPNIAIAPDTDTDEATRMLALAKPAPSPAIRAPDPRLASSLVATVPAPVIVAPVIAAPGALAAQATDRPSTVPPPSGRDAAPADGPLPAFRAPGATAEVQPRAETLIDPFAATGGNATAQGQGPAPLTGLAALPPDPGGRHGGHHRDEPRPGRWRRAARTGGRQGEVQRQGADGPDDPHRRRHGDGSRPVRRIYLLRPVPPPPGGPAERRQHLDDGAAREQRQRTARRRVRDRRRGGPP